MSMLAILILMVVNMMAKNVSQKDVIKVHFVPHSHMDAGWLQTYDYYYK